MFLIRRENVAILQCKERKRPALHAAGLATCPLITAETLLAISLAVPTVWQYPTRQNTQPPQRQRIANIGGILVRDVVKSTSVLPREQNPGAERFVNRRAE
jgi:hypothetical protein